MQYYLIIKTIFAFVTTFFYMENSNDNKGGNPKTRNSERLIQNLELKKMSVVARVTTRLDAPSITTTFIQGSIRNDFFNDCIKRGATEAEVARAIIGIHYEIIKSNPQLSGLDFKEIRDAICKNRY